MEFKSETLLLFTEITQSNLVEIYSTALFMIQNQL